MLISFKEFDRECKKFYEVCKKWVEADDKDFSVSEARELLDESNKLNDFLDRNIKTRKAKEFFDEFFFKNYDQHKLEMEICENALKKASNISVGNIPTPVIN